MISVLVYNAFIALIIYVSLAKSKGHSILYLPFPPPPAPRNIRGFFSKIRQTRLFLGGRGGINCIHFTCIISASVVCTLLASSAGGGRGGDMRLLKGGGVLISPNFAKIPFPSLLFLQIFKILVPVLLWFFLCVISYSQ